MTLDEINQLPATKFHEAIYQSLSVERIARETTALRPFHSLDALISTVTDLWLTANDDEKLEAFAGHPQIGDVSTLAEKYRATAATAGHEQQGIQGAELATLEALKNQNDAYLKRFGFIFIVFATGKSAAQMLALLERRLPLSLEEELINAAKEQQKITQLRLRKLCHDS